ncbi:Hypothetical protein R9X50_00163900 [Acrodontium crateriforme]|uniref:Uncharacterized protein n=1 Tax=Acrodontium crateriforme TaxID=150365 RepID=A0AAQ3LZC9_9PEZI|nr:Hypothetical protein R9X50_00163900 [Acrodontium crateriforme]
MLVKAIHHYRIPSISSHVERSSQRIVAGLRLVTSGVGSGDRVPMGGSPGTASTSYLLPYNAISPLVFIFSQTCLSASLLSSTFKVPRYFFKDIQTFKSKLSSFSHKSRIISSANMFQSKMLFGAAGLYASATAFTAVWISMALPIQHGKTGPYNVHRVIKQGRRIPWKRLPKAI